MEHHDRPLWNRRLQHRFRQHQRGMVRARYHISRRGGLMGRAYAEELALLEATYMHALATEITPLRESIDALRAKPLIIVGSGGSASACHLTARLHETNARLSARVMTPLEFVQHPIPHEAGVLLLSAGGANPDIIAAASHAVAGEYAPVIGLCTRPGTPLRDLLAAHRHTIVHEYSGPSVKDGFLATNSLLLTATLLVRAYGCEPPASLPSLSTSGSGRGREPAGSVSAVDPTLLDALGRQSVVVLANAWGTAAAHDLESKWAESGFAAVTVTDARNFAHGRHYGLSQRLDQTAIIGLVTHDDLGVTERTVAQFPAGACAVVVRSSLPGVGGALDLLARVIQFAGVVGIARGLDPGRPRVPAFGRKLYRAGIPKRVLLRAHLWRSGISNATTHSQHDVWIRRKVTQAVWETAANTDRERWRNCCSEWISGVERTPIGGVVFDYDGTLCEADERFTTPSAPVADALAKLVDEGLVVGIATGRGGSAREALQAVLPDRLWGKIILGMYNGGVLGTLADSPSVTSPDESAVNTAHAVLTASPLVAALATIKVQPCQLSVRARHPLPEGVLQRFVVEALAGSFATEAVTNTVSYAEGRHMPALVGGAAVARARGTGGDSVRVFSSGHTVDVIFGSASKLRVVSAVRDVIHSGFRVVDSEPRTSTPSVATAPAVGVGTPSNQAPHVPTVMTIGDQGHLGGNDWLFLAHALGLSVERVSSAFDGCWNVAPVGVRRTAALHAYLDALLPAPDGTFRWSPVRAFSSTRITSAAARHSIPQRIVPSRHRAAASDPCDSSAARDSDLGSGHEQ